MKRYEDECHYACGACEFEMVECECGTYVRHEDAMARIAELEEALKFYANKEDYVYSLQSNIWDDNGEVARKALGSEP